MEEHCQGNSDMQGAVARLEGNLDRLIHLLEGNGQPGFIQITNGKLEEVNTWQRVHDALRDENRWKISRNIVVLGLVFTAVQIGIAFYFKKG